MIGTIYSPPRTAITEKQLAELEDYQTRQKLLTTRQYEKMQSLLEKRDNSHTLQFSATAISYLLFLYSVHKYGRRYILKSSLPASMYKGLVKEKDAIQLVTDAFEIPLFRDKRRMKNDRLAAQMDVFDAPKIETSNRVYEIKNCSDLGSFFRQMKAPLKKNDYLQMQGYLAVTDKEQGEIFYCLTEYPEQVIQEQRDILMVQMCPDGVVTQKFEEHWEFAERKMRYLDMPPRERVFSVLVERDDEVIRKIYDRVDEVREWLFEHEEFHLKLLGNRYHHDKKVRI